MTKENELERFAQFYTSLGFSIIPVSKTKIPYLSSWQRRRIAQASEVREWIEKFPDLNLGVVTGSASQIVILDVDVSHGEDGLESLKAMEREYGPLPKTPVARTATGGEHYYFRYQGQPLRRAIRFRPGLDLLAEDSYAVLPPSTGKNGRVYAWDVDAHIEDVELAELPSWLIADTQKTTYVKVNHWPTLATSGVSAGSRNETLTKLAGHLLRRYVDPHLARELVLAFNDRKVKPPLPESEVFRLCDSIAKKEFQRRINQETRNG